MLIVIGSDDRYALPLAVTIHSTLRRIQSDVSASLLIVDAGISTRNRRKIERAIDNARSSTEVEWAQPPMDQFFGMRTTNWGSPASYLPLLIPTLVSEHDFALYLDSDLLVFGDVTELATLGLESPRAHVHAVLDYGFHSLGEALKGDACSRLRLDPQAPYFNSGVMLINLKVWKDENTAERAFAFARDHPEVMRFTDQDALNAVIEGSWEQLDVRWNVLAGSIDQFVDRAGATPSEKIQMRAAIREFPQILHFSGPQKPWKPGYDRIGKRAYRDELEASGWFDDSTEYWSWRLRVALLSPWVKLRRFAIKFMWPVVVRSRLIRERLRAANH